ncbi:helicase POLQ-like [Thalassophryne amazonica]|uniref:helicase POLQ-like n=1 Tax=Thalassophryne amazonica TaxID=390379 RepID=UPI0014709043|nr:helicase POLQ-like [Thalassophryne amazonica]
MNIEKHVMKTKRISSRKRSKCSFHTQLTPANKRGANSPDDTRYCSDAEDLFGDYDSILESSSVLAQLDSAELHEHQGPGADLDNPGGADFTAVRAAADCFCRKELLTELVLEDLRNAACEELPAPQVEGQNVFPARLDSVKTSTPCRTSEKTVDIEIEKVVEGEAFHFPKARRSVAEQLKRTMLVNAAAPACFSRTVKLKEAVVSEELHVAMQAMETVSTETTDLGPFFGLPSEVKDLLCKHRGIQSLYDWQETCLNLDSIQQRKNLIYSLPTSGGKTLVAEILILRELLCRRKDCLFILPYISLVQEKVRGLATFGLELDFMVEEYAGSKGKFPPIKRRSKKSLYVATIEKAHSLVNSLIETSRIQDLGLVVVDELHMLADGSRGAVMEMTLVKLMYSNRTTQIIGMSATLRNIKDLQMFLKAEHYTNDFRPVQLKEYVKLKDTIYEVDPKEDECFTLSRVLAFKYSSAMQKTDPDHVIALVTEVIPTHSCLVFCPTKKNCENVALMICKYLKEGFVKHKQAEKSLLLKQLTHSGNGSMCPVLQRTVPYGLAYHHSGLTNEERKLVEEAYSNGVLCLLTCTSTLAAGINLPARSTNTTDLQSQIQRRYPGKGSIDTPAKCLRWQSVTVWCLILEATGFPVDGGNLQVILQEVLEAFPLAFSGLVYFAQLEVQVLLGQLPVIHLSNVTHSLKLVLDDAHYPLKLGFNADDGSVVFSPDVEDTPQAALAESREGLQVAVAKSLVCAPVEKCHSQLLHDDGRGILSLILSLIGLNMTSSLEEIREVLRGTLLSVQEKQLCVDKSMWQSVEESVELLREKGLITAAAQSLQVTKLGRATYKGSVDLTYSDMLYRDLDRGLEGLLLNSYLHLVYLVTPYDMISQCKPDWMIYFHQITALSAAEQKMCASVGVPESFITRKAAGQAVKKNVNGVVVRRLYLALVLFSLLKETSLWSVAEKFQLSRGFIQTLLSSSSAFCSCVLHFTEELEEFWPFKALFTELTRRLSYCAKAELIPLMEVSGVMEFRARQLYDAGYKTLPLLAHADPRVLARTIDNLYKNQASQMVASAKMLLKEKAAVLQEEVDDLLMVPTEPL